eukprot:CAMPEP_0119037366 /NCGR_PEP_ID=MMETSP1177-20130426/5683_1 /TAXON_ID=2985 /ORGANISM="Ochromonas sp, Strain CCMP1899" /LENGTH=146 /DNA_ID=CAMNT_0006998553 /DNA_START=836 /DNA_END=1276 /DNA_ORIENTATION=-
MPRDEESNCRKTYDILKGHVVKQKSNDEVFAEIPMFIRELGLETAATLLSLSQSTRRSSNNNEDNDSCEYWHIDNNNGDNNDDNLSEYWKVDEICSDGGIDSNGVSTDNNDLCNNENYNGENDIDFSDNTDDDDLISKIDKKKKKA